MSAKHPVIAVTGSSGAGTTTTSLAFRKIFAQLNLHAAEVEGDTSERGHSREAVMDSVVRSMEDYINYITPQFSRTHLNFQRVPTVDTSNPFAAKGIPSLDESFVVIHFRNLEGIDFPWLLAMLQGSFISHINTLVVPGGKMGLAMELIMLPLVQRLMEGKKIE